MYPRLSGNSHIEQSFLTNNVFVGKICESKRAYWNIHIIFAGVSVAVSVLVTVVLMCIREANKKAIDDIDKDELLEEFDSLEHIGDM